MCNSMQMLVRNRESENTHVARRNENRAGNALQSEYLAMETGDASERKGEHAMYSGTSVCGGHSTSHTLES